VSAIEVDRPSAGVARVVIDNPPANALGRTVRASLMAALAALDADLDVRAVILTGCGRAFCSGDDLAEAAARGEAARESFENFAELFARLEALRPPTIAAVNGWCTGGGLELALCCDLRIAAAPARFVCAGVNVGLIASAHRLPRLVGLSRAKSMLMTGLPVDAATAEQWGLVTAVHAPDALDAAALSLAERIASRAPLAVEAVKRCANQAFDLEAQAARAAFERELLALAATQDHAAALKAFPAKTEPKFERR
jgi:enoyl-CoA hydratase/carnithine racemase